MAKPSNATRLVRLKPYNPRRGVHLRQLMHGPSGKIFKEEAGWYKINDAKLVAWCRAALQVETDDLSQPAFDVCTPAEAAEIDRRERKSKIMRNADDANDLTTADLRRVEGRGGRTTAADLEEPRARAARPSRARKPAEPRERSMV